MEYEVAEEVFLRGAPTGKTIKVGQHEAYLALPGPGVEHQNSGILYIPDILSIWQNSMLLADQFAAKGYVTVIIDLFKGDAIAVNEYPGADLNDWIKNGRNGAGPHTAVEIDPIIREAVSYMTKELGVQNIGAVGYCFGAKYLVRHYQSGIKAGFIAHPSFVEEDELSNITGPLSIAAAEIDAIFPAEKRHRSEEILKENGNVYQMNLYSGVSHGFAVRCNVEERRERFGKEQAFKQAVEFFDYWLL